jgi:succinyl-diaminopimelate desuccinylase
MTVAALDPVSLLSDLIRCPSVTPTEGGALSYLERVLAGAGFRVERVVFSEPGTPDVENLYARIGVGAPYLLFAGHTDVVPPGDAARWTRAPFSGDVAEGKVWGRGATDMKGGIAAFLSATLAHLAEHGPTKGSIGFLITGDEEGPAINGTVKLLRWAAARGERFDACVLGEPTNVDAVGDMVKIGRRGSYSATLAVAGRQGHVAYPHLADNPVPRLVAAVAALSTPLDGGNEWFQPSNLEIVGLEAGAGAFNVIPAEARAKLNVRFNDGWTGASLEAELRRRIAAAIGEGGWTLEPQKGNSESFLTKPGPFVDAIVGAIHDVTGRAPALSTTGGTSDARFIKDFCPVVEFGLVGKTMHQVDEHAEIADLLAGTEVYRGILQRFFASRA